ncbi:unconventional myosin-VIIb isoform X1 [Alosa sapidissima]|uniref:unconventional myosin-VIIb isoform X1 n=2 Tax=Alosa sapidissima TaxID=34773 RepID=UPI001C087E46|nr:unconventional myosin-VIIb isoform X1 [Alosa sapidissima]XP_041913734.1 unconventional myosin-VIIb isoform X1 [Alosa sapidissima]XP_041913735.1 unconventional myosin-VIIb isoform X1 [Alosa sapidissima]
MMKRGETKTSAMVILQKGDYVWIDSGIGVPIGAQVKLSERGDLQLLDDEGIEHKLTKKLESSLKTMHPTSINGVDDMIRLGDLNEAGLLRNLLVRHKEGTIYTYTGSILVAVNPYQLLPLYTVEQVQMYTDRRLGELPPHVFAVADSCFFNMRRNRKDQCCVISGESGAGKTESTKLMLQFLAAVSGQRSWIEQQVLEANPILEAFGNAKTVRNDNSSRFGKYIDISFTEGGAIESARIEQYLLEKSRVCHQASDERNYHIFYCMLLGMSADQKKILSLESAAEYNYLTMGKCTSCEGRDDIKEYAHFRSAMKILTFSENDTWEINKLLAAILHLGNVNFEATILNNLESCDIRSSAHFTMVAKLLEVDTKALDVALTQRSFMTNRESVSKPLNSEQALAGRDAFVKAIYGKMFVWIVEKINSAISKPFSEDSKPTSIGLLDIFGFENFTLNSFEQLCINFANEQLQQFFVKHVFKLEQEEYAHENIVWTLIEYNDNQRTLDVLANKSLNVLSLIDEESNFPKGTDTTLLNKLNHTHGKTNIYISPKNNHDTKFGIQHFAGVVFYDSKGFLEKNRDALSPDLIQLVEKSSNKLLKQIFSKDLSPLNNVKNTGNHKLIFTPSNSLRQTTDNKKRVPTLSGQFRQSLDALMKTLMACQPYFIRCIKPNDFKKPMLFDRELCMRQLRYSGMLETIRIRKAGYPIRHTFQEFLDRYRVLLNSAECDPKTESAQDCSKWICGNVLTGKDDWKVGKTKIFLKDFHDTDLELARDYALHYKAQIIQRVLRGYKYRRSFLRKKAAALVLQKHWRGHKGRKQFRVVRLGFSRLQATVRSRQMRFQYERKRTAALVIQKHARGLVVRREFERKRKAVIILQANTRGMLARKAVKKRKRDAFMSVQDRRNEELASRERQRRLEDILRHKREQEAAAQQPFNDHDQAMDQAMDDIFGFLPPVVGGQEGKAPVPFKDLEGQRIALEEIDLDETPLAEDLPEEDYDDDLDEYSFSKFAAMYFQGAASDTHIRRRLPQPLLYHDDEGDVLAAKTVWWLILRFMGDLPEPKAHQQVRRNGPLDAELQTDLAERQNRRLSNMIGMNQRMGNAKLRKISTAPDERNRKGSMFTNLLTRRKDSSMPEEVVLNRKGSSIPEDPKGRKPSMFADKLSKNRKVSAIPEEGGANRKASAAPNAMNRRKPSMISEEAEDEMDGTVSKPPTLQTLSEEDVVGREGGFTLDRPLSSLEKLHLIVGYGIVRRDLRDEIYCQICKQLQENAIRSSFYRGWILLSLCLGIFPPNDRFIKYLQNFIRSGPKEYAPYCAERLRRTMANGVRGEPPSWLELQATKAKKPMAISITLMDGRLLSLPIDSATTSKEICITLSKKLKLYDIFGFSLYMALYDKVWSLGNARDHVMDAISQCEQEVKRKGGQEQHAPWRLYFRKEIFTPWHDCSEDAISTDLIYRQVIRGLKCGEYQCDKEDDLIQLAAKHFYVQHGADTSTEKAKSVVEECISSTLQEAKTEEKWVQMVSAAHMEGPYINSKKRAPVVKAEVVDYAKQKWPLLFSKYFEVVRFSGPALPKNKFILAINWTGITFLDEREKKVLQLTFPEVTGVNTMREGKGFGQSVCLLTLKGDFMLNSISAADIADVVTMFLGGLRERSQYAVTLQESGKQEDPTFLTFKKGELILLIKDDEYSPERGWFKGKNDRTGQIGALPSDAILVLPTLTKPTNEIISLMTLSPDQRKNVVNATLRGTSTERLALFTLKEYSFQYFRPPTRDVNKQVMSKGAAPERLWANSREPIRQPLLKKLIGQPQPGHLACQAFTAILKYMGDYPTRQQVSPLELTDIIFGGATKHEELRDEIYCQIMKQMTSNNNRHSVEHGWHLLWLCCGLFPPSNILFKHAQRFLETRRRDPMATECLKRLQASLRAEPRKFPPHKVELDAVQQNSFQILHKVNFPNDTAEIFEVGPHTRIKDLTHTIATKLELLSAEGFTMFMKTPDKVLSLNETDYFFDSLRQITDYSKTAKRVREGAAPVNVQYQVFFMRKLWFNVVPGRDLEADLIFHFPQELPKYLRGYHQCSKEELVRLAGLLLRVKIDNDQSQLLMIPKMLKELVPNDMLKAMSADEWKKQIAASYNKQAALTVEDAAVHFLKVIFKWTTFGCAFFEVKQTSEPNYPDIVRLAIGRQGVIVMHPKTKEILASHPYNKIANWRSGSTYFHMTVGSLVGGNKLLCETSLGYKIDDLITSYVNMYLNETKVASRQRNQHYR